MDDDDDLYGGYTATSSSFNPAPNDDEFNYDAPTAAGGPGGPMRQGTAGGRLGTAAPARPMTASNKACLLYTSPSPRDATLSRMPSSA